MYFNTFNFGLSSSATGNLHLKDKVSGPKTHTVCYISIGGEEAQVGCNGVLFVAANTQEETELPFEVTL